MSSVVKDDTTRVGGERGGKNCPPQFDELIEQLAIRSTSEKQAYMKQFLEAFGTYVYDDIALLKIAAAYVTLYLRSGIIITLERKNNGMIDITRSHVLAKYIPPHI